MKLMKTIVMISVILVLIIATGCAEAPKTLEKNFGYSHGVVNITSDGVETLNVEEIVPPKAELCANLEDAGFTITEYNTAWDSDTLPERIYAEKDGLFMDICYGISTGQARELFTHYEAAYNEYYLIAQNEYYVYAVSDEETFKTAGFETLETNGILFVWE